MIPEWLSPIEKMSQESPRLTSQGSPTGTPREAAVLILIGPCEDHGDISLIERAVGKDKHSGQPAFPGGQVEPFDASRSATALREAHEETGLDPESVHVIAQLPDLWVPPSNYLVTPILAWWHTPHDLSIGDAAEVQRIQRVPITEITNPSHRIMVRTPSGFIGPGFNIASMLVWGFTGGLLSDIVDLGGWTQPWDQSRIKDIREL